MDQEYGKTALFGSKLILFYIGVAVIKLRMVDFIEPSPPPWLVMTNDQKCDSGSMSGGRKALGTFDGVTWP